MKIGSLFDGSGGFPLAATMCGIEPVWAAEIEPYPIAVTRSRFPNMKHLGSVIDINGAEIEPVDIISFGSPCQDLSVAGKRAGLKHTENGDDETTRSGLFMEAIRIIKEMREATNGEYPRYAIWENVPGAFSSNKGEDFRIVLEEFVKIAEPTAIMPEVPKAGWPYADVYCGDGWSMAYRVLDAQYWGVPQRRRRIYLVADFRGQRAGKISFEREGLRGNPAQSRTPWQAVAGDAENCSGTADCDGTGNCLTPWDVQSRRIFTADGSWPCMRQGVEREYVVEPIAVATQQGGAEITTNGICPTVTAAAGMSGNNQPWIALEAAGFDMYNQQSTGDKSRTLKTPVGGDDLPVVCIKEQHLFENHSQDSRYKGPLDVCPMLPAQLGTGGNNQPFVVEQHPFCKSARARSADDATTRKDGVVANTINTFDVGEARANELVVETAPTYDRHAVAYGIETFHCTSEEEKTPTLKARDWKDPHVVAYWDGGQTAGTLTANNAGGNQRMPDKENFNCVVECHPKPAIRYIVRRLTPTECARLQGFPDNWGDIDEKADFTDEEYAFWLNVRNTHAAINGKAVKDYTKAQMLTWYNKLHTDSSEYKLWGNGIALPCALYVMQGIAGVQNEH